MSTLVHAAIAARFPAPEFATFFEVRDQAGFDGRRSADAVTMGVWKSRGQSFQGFEVKVTRSDWLRERRDPAKSEPILKFCDRWWLAVFDDTIVKDGELPETWGLMVLDDKKRLVIRKQAPLLQAEPFNRSFVASLLRAATGNMVPRIALDTMVAERVKVASEARAESWKRQTEQTKGELANLHRRIEDFEKVSGVRLDTWTDPRRLGAAVRFVLENGDSAKRILGGLRDRLGTLIGGIDGAIAEFSEPIAREENPTTGGETG